MAKARGGVAIPSLAELRASPGYPSKRRLESGPAAVIECIQEIPCNPCERACRFNAIIVGSPITNLPRLVEEKCKGCGDCIAACPGLAIFLVNTAYSPEEAAISIPYEYLPLPEVGSTVDALNRCGERVCGGRVIRVTNPKKNDKTAVVTVAVAKHYSDHVRNFRIANEKTS